MAEDCGNVKIAVGEAADQLVGDVMIKRPKTLPVEATVADVRRLFENGSVQTGLLVDDGRFRAAIERDNVPDPTPDEAAAIEFAVTPIAKVRPTTRGKPSKERLVGSRARRSGAGRRVWRSPP